MALWRSTTNGESSLALNDLNVPKLVGHFNLKQWRELIFYDAFEGF